VDGKESRRIVLMAAAGRVDEAVVVLEVEQLGNLCGRVSESRRSIHGEGSFLSTGHGTSTG
jgi:hypothetical protein